MYPQRVPNSISLLSHMLWQLLSSFHLHVGGPKERTLYFKIEPSVLGSLHSFFFLINNFMGQSNWLIAQNKIELERHLVLLIGEALSRLQFGEGRR
jgi:hypothetical protein